MSVRAGKIMALAGVNLAEKSEKELKKLFKDTLQSGMHGLCFSPYEEGQEAGDQISEEQIHRRMKIIKPYTKWIRTFSCTDGNELIPEIAHQYGIKTLVGAWLGNDDDINKREILGLIKLAKKGYVDIAAVGNEVMYRGDLTENELLDFMSQVREAIPQEIPMGYVDAYYEFTERPRITEACDVILANCYPFWEGCPLEYSLLYMKEMFAQATVAAKGKKVIVTETGWPNFGSNFEGSIPSHINAVKYFLNSQQWSKEDGIEMFYFSSFDESWKVGDEGDVGAFWGLWDKNESLKF
ncbi:glycosyl hydrolase family 17 protein [Psychroserpens sp.]|uniref:glycoside hydrolase family 17 protein n=1 Tax=Psychroserpens sp. TaxID=2020870 RepID=UPI00385FD12A